MTKRDMSRKPGKMMPKEEKESGMHEKMGKKKMHGKRPMGGGMKDKPGGY